MTKPLKGLYVLNTRPLTTSHLLARAILQEGGTLLSCPGLVIQKKEDDWIAKLPPLSSVNVAIFTSQNAVTFSIPDLKRHGISWPSTLQNIAIGPATKMQLMKENLTVSELPLQSDSEHLLSLPILQSIRNQTILLFKGAGGRGLIEPTLTSHGANLISLDVYERVKPKALSDTFLREWHQHPPHIILLTSEESMRNLLELFERTNISLKSYPVISVSSRLTLLAKEAGFQNIITSKPELILETLIDFNRRRLHG